MKSEGIGQIKIALAGTDTSFLCETCRHILGVFASSESDEEEDVLVEEKKTSEAVEEVVAGPKEMGSLAMAEMYLPLHGPKSLSHYHCHVPPCTLNFVQKGGCL